MFPTHWLDLFALRLRLVGRRWRLRVAARPTRRTGQNRLTFERLEDRALLSATVVNLGLDGTQYVWSPVGDVVAFQVNESAQGGDFNGDGDQLDSVVHVYDASTAELTNLGLDGQYGYTWSPNGRHLNVLTFESRQGGTDLNGDGDALDWVMHVHDTATGVTSSLGVDAYSGSTWSPEGRYLALRVFEGRQGNADLNADGDAADSVMQIYDTVTGVTVNTGLEGLTGYTWSPTGGSLAVQVSERSQGNQDLNGDGDAIDRVLHVYSTATGLATNAGIDGSSGYSWSPDGLHLTALVSEANQGGILNGDGDTSDSVLHVFSVATGVVTNLGLAQPVGQEFYTWSPDSTHLAVRVYEPDQGNDLNADGHIGDYVMHVYATATGVTTNLGIDAAAGYAWSPDGAYLAVRVYEYYQGTDLNGDGDVNYEQVMHVYATATGVTTNLGLDGSQGYAWSPDGAHLAFRVYESSQGTDLNGDGDVSNESVMHVYATATGLTTNLGIDGDYYHTWSPDGANLAFRVYEPYQGTDLNSDGDRNDGVMHVYATATGLTTNLGIDGQYGYTWSPDGAHLAILVYEGYQGVDLNGDGHVGDTIAFVYAAATGLTTNVRIDNSIGTAWSPAGRHLLLGAAESAQLVDLNGDGDIADEVLFLHDTLTGETTNLRIDGITGGYGTGWAWNQGGAYLAVRVAEAEQGRDLNGDGDINDFVLHVASASNSPPTAADDDLSTDKNSAVMGNLVTTNNGHGVDSDPEGQSLTVLEVNGVAANVGTPITLASGARLTVNADGSYTYDPNDAFNFLGQGASANDMFAYTVRDSGGGVDTATVSVRIDGSYVTYVGSTAMVTGTDGVDSITYDVVSRALVINGVRHTMRPEAMLVSIDGRGARDVLSLFGTAGDDTAILRPGTVVFEHDATHTGFDLTGVNLEVITLDGRGGSDRATLHDSTGDDRIYVRPASAAMVGATFENNLYQFEQVTGLLTAGSDLARFFDSAGDDTVVAGPGNATLSGAGFLHSAQGFDTLVASANAGGNDLARLAGSTGQDVFVGSLGSAAFSGVGFSLQLVSFDVVLADGAGGIDIARVTGTAGDDLFTATPTTARLTGTGLDLRLQNFERQFATAGGGAADVADLTDSAGNDVFVGLGSDGTMSGAGFVEQATGFDTVRIRGNSGGVNRRTLTTPLGYDLVSIGSWI